MFPQFELTKLLKSLLNDVQIFGLVYTSNSHSWLAQLFATGILKVQTHQSLEPWLDKAPAALVPVLLLAPQKLFRLAKFLHFLLEPFSREGTKGF